MFLCHDWPFCMCVFCKKTSFSTLILGSVFSNCVYIVFLTGIERPSNERTNVLRINPPVVLREIKRPNLAANLRSRPAVDAVRTCVLLVSLVLDGGEHAIYKPWPYRHQRWTLTSIIFDNAGFGGLLLMLVSSCCNSVWPFHLQKEMRMGSCGWWNHAIHRCVIGRRGGGYGCLKAHAVGPPTSNIVRIIAGGRRSKTTRDLLLWTPGMLILGLGLKAIFLGLGLGIHWLWPWMLWPWNK